MNEKNQSVWMEDNRKYGDISPWDEKNIAGNVQANKISQPVIESTSADESYWSVTGSTSTNEASQPATESTPANEASQPMTESTPANKASQPATESTPADKASQPATESTPADKASQPATESTPADKASQPATGNTTTGRYDIYHVKNNVASVSVPASNSPVLMQGSTAHKDTEETKRLKENFDFFGPAAFLYAVFYVFCMFRNGSGITYPFFVGGSLLFMCLSLSKLGITLKKGSKYYMAAMILLGISTFCTDDARIIFFNKLGCFLLMMSLLLKQFCNTQNWKLGKYLGSICVMVVASIGAWNRPVADASEYKKSGVRKMDRRIWYVGLGLLVGIPLMLVVLLLLASADAVFRQMTQSILENINLYNIFSVLWRMALVYFASYALVAWLCCRKIKDEVVDRRTGEPVLAITITGLLTLLYLLFCTIQVEALFLGRLRLPAGYTYAIYAREGFFQLLVVSILNLVIVLVCMSFFRESKVLKAILVIMSFCTFVMIASSAMRMIIYIRYYYLTFLRVLVLWALALLAVLLVGVVIHIIKETFPLFRYSVAVVAVLYLALSFAHPDYIIARVNVANASHSAIAGYPEQERNRVSEWHRVDLSQEEVFEGSFFLTSMPYEDYSYLRKLSADAAPVLIPYLEELGYDMEAFYAQNAVFYARDKGIGDSSSSAAGFGYYWMRHIQDSTKNFGIRTYNVSRHMALRAFRRSR